MPQKPFIAFTGLMGVGKTTRTELLTKHLGLTPVYEKFGENPFLKKFYEDKKRWAFASQEWFLQQKIAQLEKIQQLLTSPQHTGVLQDMAVYQDAAFARNLFEQGFMSQEDWEKYEDLLDAHAQKFPKPIIFHLTAEIPTVLERITQRGREFEKGVDAAYLKGLQQSLDYWLKKIASDVTIVEFGTEGVDLETNPEHRKEFVAFAKSYL